MSKRKRGNTPWDEMTPKNVKDFLLSESVSTGNKERLLHAIRHDPDQNRKTNMLISWFSHGNPVHPNNTKKIMSTYNIITAVLRKDVHKLLRPNSGVSDSKKNRLRNALVRGPFSRLPRELTQQILNNIPRANQISFHSLIKKVPKPSTRSESIRNPIPLYQRFGMVYDHYMLMLDDLLRTARNTKLDPWKQKEDVLKIVKTLPSFATVERLIAAKSDVTPGSQLHKLLMTPSLFITQPIMVDIYQRVLEKARSMHPIHLARILAMTHYAYVNHGMFYGHTNARRRWPIYAPKPDDNRPLFTAVLEILKTKKPIPHDTLIKFPSSSTENKHSLIAHVLKKAYERRENLRNSNTTNSIEENRYIHPDEIIIDPRFPNLGPNVGRYENGYVLAKTDLEGKPVGIDLPWTVMKKIAPLTLSWASPLTTRGTEDEIWVFKEVACNILATAFITRNYHTLYDDTYMSVASVFSSLCPDFTGEIYASFTRGYKTSKTLPYFHYFNNNYRSEEEWFGEGIVNENDVDTARLAMMNRISHAQAAASRHVLEAHSKLQQKHMFSSRVIYWYFIESQITHHTTHQNDTDFILTLDPDLQSLNNFYDLHIPNYHRSKYFHQETIYDPSRISQFIAAVTQACTQHFRRRYVPHGENFLPSEEYFLRITNVISLVHELDTAFLRRKEYKFLPEGKAHNSGSRDYYNAKNSNINNDENSNAFAYKTSRQQTLYKNYMRNLYGNIESALLLLKPIHRQNTFIKYIKMYIYHTEFRANRNRIPQGIPITINRIARTLWGLLHHKSQVKVGKVVRVHSYIENAPAVQYPRELHSLELRIAGQIERIFGTLAPTHTATPRRMR